jgi:hypothetical protein
MSMEDSIVGSEAALEPGDYDFVESGELETRLTEFECGPPSCAWGVPWDPHELFANLLGAPRPSWGWWSDTPPTEDEPWHHPALGSEDGDWAASSGYHDPEDVDAFENDVSVVGDERSGFRLDDGVLCSHCWQVALSCGCDRERDPVLEWPYLPDNSAFEELFAGRRPKRRRAPGLRPRRIPQA